MEKPGCICKRTRSNFLPALTTTANQTNSLKAHFRATDFSTINFDSAHKSLGILDRRLLFEDFLRLQLGQTVIVLVYRDYKHFQQWKQMMQAHYDKVSVLTIKVPNQLRYEYSS